MTKYNLPIITAEEYNLSPDRYQLRKGSAAGAPLCPFGNHFEWIGFDKENKNYVRFTKSIFKRLIKLTEAV